MSNDVAQVYTQLEKLINAGGNDVSKINTFCDRILSVHPCDLYALRCKGTVLLNQGKYEQALATFTKLTNAKYTLLPDATQAVPAGAGSSSEDREEDQLELSFVIGYCLYRLARYDQVKVILLDIAKTVGGEEELPAQVANLLAQTHYNLEEYEAAVTIYERLLKNEDYRDEQEQEELTNNLCAAYAAINADKAKSSLQHADEKTHDLLYNAATALVESKRYGEAMQMLDDAAKLCVRDCSPDDKRLDFFNLPEPTKLTKDERSFFEAMAMIQVQRAFLFFAQGNEEEAESILKIVLAHKPAAVSTYAVACTNWVAIKRHHDFFESHRKLKHAQTPAVDAKLTKRQKLLIKYNTAMLLLHTGRLAACHQTIDKMAAENPSSELVSLALVAVMLRENKISKAEETLNKYIGGSSSASSSSLTVAQVKLEQGDLPAALNALRDMENFRLRPAAVATLAEGYAILGDLNESSTVINEAIEKTSDAKLKTELLQWAGNFYLQHSMPEEAVKVLEAAAKANKSLAQKLLPHIVNALSEIDASAAAEKAKGLAPLSSSVDARTIEQLPLPRQKIVEKGYARDADIDGPRKQAKGARRRPKRRLPKNLLPEGKKQDPERWIPINIRTYIVDLPPKRKRDLRRQRADEAAQKRKAAEKRKTAEKEAAAAAAAN